MNVVNNDQTLLRLHRVAQAVLDSLGVPTDTPVGELPGWDSLQMVRFIIECEREFGIHLLPRQLNQLQTLREMARDIANMRHRVPSSMGLPPAR